jgi:benzodiazapine receptor
MSGAEKIAERKHKWLALVGWLATPFAVAAVSGFFTAHSIPVWYAGIAKPDFNPPNWVFGPVWSVLYALMGVAAWLVWRLPESAGRTRALRWFWLQLLLNFAWSWIFFGQHWILAAAVEVVVLWLAILMMTLEYARVKRTAAWLTTPYLAWVTFAAVLNWAVWRVNVR